MMDAACLEGVYNPGEGAAVAQERERAGKRGTVRTEGQKQRSINQHSLTAPFSTTHPSTGQHRDWIPSPPAKKNHPDLSLPARTV
jgi:hypothetical protein